MTENRPLSAEDRLVIEDVLGRYCWALDTGDVDAAVALFTPDAVVRYDDGPDYRGADGLRAFVVKAIGGADGRGRMHVNRTLFAERRGEIVLLRSYLIVPRWTVHDNAVALLTQRYVEDSFRLTGDGWRMCERVIYRWNDVVAGRFAAAAME